MDLTAILIETLQGYSTQGVNGYTYLTRNDENTRFAVIAMVEHEKPYSFLCIAAHIQNDSIIVYHDANNKPLVDALVQNGVPRDKIVLAYLGETLATAD